MNVTREEEMGRRLQCRERKNGRERESICVIVKPNTSKMSLDNERSRWRFGRKKDRWRGWKEARGQWGRGLDGPRSCN